LAQDPRAVFTHPQSTRNEMQLLQLNATFRLTATSTLGAQAYHRHFLQHLTDGNTTAVQQCLNQTDYLCLQGDNLYPDDVLFAQNGAPVRSSVLPAGATPGEIDHSSTATATNGATLQYAQAAPLLGHENSLALGASIDDSTSDYQAQGELGQLLPTLEVLGSGTIIDQALSPTASPPIEAPVAVRSRTRYVGVYVTDTLMLTDRLAGTVSGRFNQARIDLEDLARGALNGAHTYQRFNPGIGITYRLGGGVTAYAGYSEANRAPTAGELSCADPTRPCLLGAFLVSDPALAQVVARTFETGLRGRFALAGEGNSASWNLGVFRTDNSDDILLLESPINGFGYFSNVGSTRRQGLEAAIAYQRADWQLSLGYSFVAATFRENLTLSSNSPAGDPNGEIFVHPGDRIPLTPAHRVTASLEYLPSPRWRIGADARYTSSQYLSGDASNQEPPLPAYTVVGAHASYRLTSSLQLFATVDNLFDRSYYTYGAFTELSGLPPNLVLTDPRTYSPSPPRSYFAGFHWSL
jgi:iron complex outermembrane receptor protein